MEDIEKEFIDIFSNFRKEHDLDLVESIKMLSKANGELSKECVGEITITSNK